MVFSAAVWSKRGSILDGFEPDFGEFASFSGFSSFSPVRSCRSWRRLSRERSSSFSAFSAFSGEGFSRGGPGSRSDFGDGLLSLEGSVGGGSGDLDGLFWGYSDMWRSKIFYFV